MLEKLKKYSLWFFNSFIWLGLLILAIDLITKNIVVNNMEVEQSIPLIPGFLHITYRVNTNAAFGLGIQDNPLANRIIYIVIASIAVALIIFVYVKKFNKLNKFYRACLMMITVGALGNLIDRVCYTPGYLKYPLVGVVDWIDFCGIWKYIFNIADSSLVVSVFMLVIYLIVDEIKTNKKNKAKVHLSKDDVDKKKLEASLLEATPEVKEENK